MKKLILILSVVLVSACAKQSGQSKSWGAGTPNANNEVCGGNGVCLSLVNDCSNGGGTANGSGGFGGLSGFYSCSSNGKVCKLHSFKDQWSSNCF